MLALRPLEAPVAGVAFEAAVGALAQRALRQELDLTPKPGLVDRANSGAHRDMDYATFTASIAAVSPWFAVFARSGRLGAGLAPAHLLAQLRRQGLACEQAMWAATGGVNTHKGSVFSLGLLCAAAGRLQARGRVLQAREVCDEVAGLCAGIVARDLGAATAASTAGERLYREHGLAGARGEAASGFATARRHGLAPLRQALAMGLGEQRALMEALLHLMAHNADTNLVSRGGLPGLARVQRAARRLLDLPWPTTADRVAQLQRLDQDLIGYHLSPGGSADLLAVSWFLAHLSELSPTPHTGHRHHGHTPAPQDRRLAAVGGVAL